MKLHPCPLNHVLRVHMSGNSVTTETDHESEVVGTGRQLGYTKAVHPAQPPYIY